MSSSLFEILNKRISKTEINLFVQEIIEKPHLFEELIDVLVQGNERQTNMAAWVITHCVDAQKTFLEPHVATVLQVLKTTKIDGIKRSCLRAIEVTKVDDTVKGEMINRCFDFLTSKNSALAVKAFSMSVIYNYAKHEPEILKELQLCIEDQLDYQTAGFVGRGKRIIKAINKK